MNNRRYCLISPCRDEADHIPQIIESVTAQSVPPTLWIIVDDNSSDASLPLLREAASHVDYLRIVEVRQTSSRQLGAGVINAFYAGFDTINPKDFDYICKLDIDLALPPRYFERMMKHMEEEPRLGTCSGKLYFRDRGMNLVSEKCGDENSIGPAKFYRTECLLQIGGFVRGLMWDGIDGHRCRMCGWVARSSDEPDTRIVHLRPMGSSDRGLLIGRLRHGSGQWFMGTHPVYMLASVAYRTTRPPLVWGGLAMLLGYCKSMLSRTPRYPDAKFRRFLRDYQWRCLLLGKTAATHLLDQEQASVWTDRKNQQPSAASSCNPKRLPGTN